MSNFDYDVFVSHASEDKEGFVRPLVAELERLGANVWFAERELKVGDSLTRSIDDGLRRSRFGIVVLSQAFFRKNWPQTELDALASREISTGKRVVLPVWLGLEENDIRRHSSLLADKFALSAQDGVEAVARKLSERLNFAPETTTTRGADAGETDDSPLFPELLRGRISPSAFSPIEGIDRALVARAAIAVAAPIAADSILKPADQQQFEDALANSSLESFVLSLTTPLRRAGAEHFWRRVSPTKSWIVTVARPVAPMIVARGKSCPHTETSALPRSVGCRFISTS